MGKIVILDENTSNKIAAGEVVERPASVVKEMVENSIDAGASTISVEIRNGGISYIKVTDNGLGIDEDDAELAFERHATSKIRSASDLESIMTMGFRGEALASIAAVSTVELTTRMNKNPTGMYIKVQGGVIKEVRQVGCAVGTTFVIRELFYNTPARFKFLKKDSTEAGYISDIMGRIALANPDISLCLVSNNSTVLHTPGNNDLLSAIYSVYGKETAKQVCKINYDDGKIRIEGYAGKPEIARGNRNHQSVYINGRYVKSKIVTSAIDEAYKTILMKNKFPFIVLSIHINPTLIDVNVHPTKMEVRFSQEQEIFRSVYHAVENAVLGSGQIKTIQLDERNRSVFKFESSGTPKTAYAQQDINIKGLEGKKPLQPNKASKASEVNALFTREKDDYKYESNTLVEGYDSSTNASGLAFADDCELGKTKQPEKVQDPVISLDREKVNLVKGTGEISPTLNQTQNSFKELQQVAKEQISHPKNVIAECRVIGQAFSTYILLQHSEEILMIDQHAAHERILYEKLRNKYRKNESLSQMLLAPVVIELTNREVGFLEDEHGFFASLGFIYEDFGNNCIILRSVPYIMDNNIIKELFLDIVDSVINSGKGEYKNIADSTLYTVACKAAVKANKKLGDIEIQSLLEELSRMENPYTCPHGRPTILKITKHEIEKMFKRIV